MDKNISDRRIFSDKAIEQLRLDHLEKIENLKGKLDSWKDFINRKFERLNKTLKRIHSDEANYIAPYCNEMTNLLEDIRIIDASAWSLKKSVSNKLKGVKKDSKDKNEKIKKEDLDKMINNSTRIPIISKNEIIRKPFENPNPPKKKKLDSIKPSNPDEKHIRNIHSEPIRQCKLDEKDKNNKHINPISEHIPEKINILPMNLNKHSDAIQKLKGEFSVKNEKFNFLYNKIKVELIKISYDLSDIYVCFETLNDGINLIDSIKGKFSKYLFSKEKEGFMSMIAGKTNKLEEIRNIAMKRYSSQNITMSIKIFNNMEEIRKYLDDNKYSFEKIESN